MTNISAEKEGVRVDKVNLMTLQQSNREREIVELTLRSTEETGKGGLAKGEFFYPKGDEKIDIIDSVFRNREGNAGKPGSITLRVSLPSDSEFWYPYVTSNEPNAVTLECIEVVASKDNKELELIFMEPETNQSFLESLLFYTDKGPIDPGVSVRRGVGQ